MRQRRFLACAATLVGLLALPLTPPAYGAPDPGELRKLTKEAAKLNNLYRGSVQSLEDIQLRAKKAAASVTNLQGQLTEARQDVAQIAQTAYITGSLDNVQLFSLNLDPAKALGQAANMTYMANDRTAKVQQIQALIQKSDQAQKDAAAKVKDLRAEIAKMKSKRRDIERLLAKFGFQQPGGGENLTPRMIAVRA
ncbi:MAG: hypothetical protein HOY71_43585, partial [Nonomuraea sp.]|nr:hypothetical protein [Nonomuraea sp.]